MIDIAATSAAILVAEFYHIIQKLEIIKNTKNEKSAIYQKTNRYSDSLVI